MAFNELEKFLQLKEELVSITSRLKFINEEIRSLINGRKWHATPVNPDNCESVNLKALQNSSEKSEAKSVVLRLPVKGRRSKPIYLIHAKSSSESEDGNNNN